MKKSNNISIPNLPIHKDSMYQYLNDFNNFICKLLGLPIKQRLIELSMSKPKLVKLLNEHGFKYSYLSLCSALDGHNFRSINMDYFSKIYYVLQLPLPDIDSLINLYTSSGGKIKMPNNFKRSKVTTT
jgi:hypothetical protein